MKPKITYELAPDHLHFLKKEYFTNCQRKKDIENKHILNK